MTNVLVTALEIHRRQIDSVLTAFRAGLSSALDAHLSDAHALQLADRLEQRLTNIARGAALLELASRETGTAGSAEQIAERLRALYTTPEEHTMHEGHGHPDPGGSRDSVELFDTP